MQRNYLKFKSKFSKYFDILILVIIGILIIVLGVYVMFNFIHNKNNKNIINNDNNEQIIVKKFNSFYQFSCNVYVISSNNGNILIDPGYYDNKKRWSKSS